MKFAKNIYIGCILVVLLLSAAGCKKFLNVADPNNLSGNQFFKKPDDFERFVGGLYAKFRAYTMGDLGAGGIYTQFFPAVGDFRCAPMRGVNSSNRHYITLLAANDLRNLIYDYGRREWNNGTIYTWEKITDWSAFFDIIASCNIMVDVIDKLEEGVLTNEQKAQYKGEAVFMRNLMYFFMARLYGDIPYYTEAYNRDPAPRQDMIAVLRKCEADLRTVVNNMPWTYEDPAKRCVRAMRGSALDLMMNINMWCAGFDAKNQEHYWQQTDSLGEVLLTKNQGAYSLLPIEQFHQVFKGGSIEGLFEIAQSLNNREQFGLFSIFADNMLHEPHKRNGQTRSYAAFLPKYLDLLFPEGDRSRDKRWSLFISWPNRSDPFDLEYLKFTNIFAEEGEDLNPDDNQTIFRLPDAILLRAEACANLGRDNEAIRLLNMIRNRAGASPFPTASNDDPSNLSDAIFYERWRELLGEGYYYFDIVRTRRVLDPRYVDQPIPAADFEAGAWTWPISPKALEKNPGMRLNDYWK